MTERIYEKDGALLKPKEEIIRCKDCKYWKGVLFGNKCTMLSGLDYMIGTKENAYCSFAERKESEEQ